MKYAVLSDVHANEDALRRVLADASVLSVDRIVVLGDVLGYGPRPQEALNLVRRTAALVLAGNHDDAVSGRLSAEDFIDLAEEAVLRHRAALDAPSLEWLKALPYTAEFAGARAAHGDFTDPRRFVYVDTEAAAAENFAHVTGQLLFVGHTHVPGLFVTGGSGKVHRLAPQDFALEDGKRYVVNPGSVGYPREEGGVCRSSYAIYDSVARTVVYRFLPFEVSSVMQRDGAPRHRMTAFRLAVGAACAAVLVGAGVWFAASGRRRPCARDAAASAPAAAEEAARSLVLETRSLTLAPKTRKVRANLKVDGDAAPVVLAIAFKSPAGEVTGEVTVTVKKSACQPFKVPAGSVTAHFTVSMQQPLDRPRLISFKPSVEF